MTENFDKEDFSNKVIWAIKGEGDLFAAKGCEGIGAIFLSVPDQHLGQATDCLFLVSLMIFGKLLRREKSVRKHFPNAAETMRKAFRGVYGGGVDGSSEFLSRVYNPLFATRALKGIAPKDALLITQYCAICAFLAEVGARGNTEMLFLPIAC